ncbi:1,4-dihydroxy-2-naphthoate octaprenyltransferase [Sorangium cellulosum]|uniref:1,4-dihydroxy-2-naphthoate octaprenyltransferase n=1 Tax=Sorangium cellulosum TaxID=56 RepID=A0A2L0EHE6_SORCE|nr:prenyltransferase [Sorangium cellulosum]AUX38725.1 1,4-dihydroxy-2-naphthoate octaprenyltransferase [Sorangium cellulosum]
MTAGPGSLGAWLKASRLASQPSIALPLLLGQLVATRPLGDRAPLHLGALAAVHLFGLLDQLFIVYANDVADQETDRRNRTATPFSGGSRVLVEGRLSPRALAAAALACAAGLVAVSVGLAAARGAPLLVPLALLAILLLWAYSYPPLRLSYRGGGELLQMAGVGAVLPLYGYLAQGGAPGRFPWALLVFLLPSHLGCAIATALPDEPSDRASAKRTLPVRLGGERAARCIVLLNGLSLLLAPVGLGALGLRAGAVLLVPAAATLAVLLARPAPPGSRLLLVRVAAAATATLSLVGAVILGLAAR